MSIPQVNQIMDAVEAQLSGKVLSYFQENKNEYRQYATTAYNAAKKKADEGALSAAVEEVVAREVAVPTIGEVNPAKASKFYVGSIPASVDRKEGTMWEIAVQASSWLSVLNRVGNDFPYRTEPLPPLTFSVPTPDKWDKRSTDKWLAAWADSAGINPGSIQVGKHPYTKKWQYRIKVPRDYVYQSRGARELSLEFVVLGTADVYRQKYGKAFSGMPDVYFITESM